MKYTAQLTQNILSATTTCVVVQVGSKYEINVNMTMVLPST